ncbi:MAG: LamG domain-containing protein [Anaerolineales bacterium]|nr:LamG domain-containing protein [Anaerolineales bacterium]
MARILRLSFKICLISCFIFLLVVTARPSIALPQSTPALYLPLVLKGSVLTPIPPTTQPSPTPSPTQPPPTSSPTYSLRFYGSGVNDIDRVKIPVVSGNTSLPVNIGAADFTIEFWMRFVPGENTSGPCTEGEDTWIYGNILFDRDIFGAPDYGDFGISLYGGRIAFGVHNGASGYTICGNGTLAASQWHHIAVTRRTNGEMRIFVNGNLDRQITNDPTGNISYRLGRSITGSYVNEPYLVIGAEKHDYDPNTYPSFSGWIDEVRISNIVRYTGNFTPPNAPFTPDNNTVGLYHFDEGSGTVVLDSSGATGGPSHGTRNYGGSPAGPVYDSITKRY